MSEEEPQRGSDQPLFEHGGDGLRVLVEGMRNEPALAAAYEEGRGRGERCRVQVYDIAVLERGWEPDQPGAVVGRVAGRADPA